MDNWLQSPSVYDLPPPPLGKTGWPWTIGTPPLDHGSRLSELPWITIVTPSLNQDQFIEETIRSVLLQGYPKLEYIIMDGGSTDQSLAIIKKYEPWLARWVSKPDRGQAHAINEGFACPRGSILGWINSDDYYCERAFQVVADFFQERSNVIAVGYGDVVDQQGRFLGERKITSIDRSAIMSWSDNWFLQQACFWPKSCWEAVGPLDETLRLLMDYDLWLRFSGKFDFCFIDRKLGCLRYYPDTKSYKERGRSFAEFAVVHVKNQEVSRAIEDIVALYESARDIGDTSQRTALQSALVAFRQVHTRFMSILR